ncbi:MAG: lipopolysaccharide biosynthesis protein [Proteobacteria bacterium]|nr:lipopolysaccharide biosynthesis protein [Pseudomonadota bacterium]
MQAKADIRTYIQIARRRRYQILVPALVIFTLSVLLALLLPPVYRSTATVLIETQNVSKDFLQTTVSGYVEQRLQSISQVVLGRVNLMSLIKKMELYTDLKEMFTAEEIVAKMQKDIILEPVQTEVNNPSGGRSGPATIAFNISYEGRNPNKVAEVASELASLFLQENLKSREETAKATVDFLEKQLEDIRQEMLTLEGKISVFKEEHLTELPELMQLNMQTMEKLEKDKANLQENIRSLQTRNVYLEGQLATIDPHLSGGGGEGQRMGSPREEKERLRRRYMSLKATLSEQHPDVVKAKREYEAAGKELGGGQDNRFLAEAIKEKQARLARLSETLSDKHPDVLALKREISELEKARQDTPKASSASADDASNPAYINIKTQIVSTGMEIRRAQSDLGRISSLQAEYQRRLEGTPRVEQEYQSLNRDYESAKLKYNELANRVMAARESKGLEESQIGDKFTLIAPPLVPEKPVKPQRMLIILAGFVLALGSGGGLAMLLEALDQSVSTPEDLAALTGRPPLAAIPYLPTPAELKAKSRRKRIILAVIAGGFVGLLLLAHFFFMPLDLLLLGLSRRMSAIF